MSQTNIPIKKYITPDELRKDSFALASKIALDGFKPDFIVGVAWWCACWMLCT